ncbi:NRDE family protein [Thiorhodococcus mannitoliphagus]|uniref:NRDE family protein n=1 Tax=Thiorhodococcus mannitoliphagus TaxID=329406 RepID=A0A6P1DWD3_9GAMM|nr:NRDE family protein [Thiorhodococcus mannitoliphagus]NEX22019.1 NRDE family protein [Thiorhodococcus mannitoliphagus]
MCTLVILIRPGHAWPILIAANRDEMAERASLPPARHWDDRPEVVGGLDVEAGGSWLGVNDHGVVAAVLNREGTLGSLAGKRSRGELVLEALDHAEAGEAVRALAELEPRAYRPFNLVVADPSGAYWLRHAGDGDIGVFSMSAGLHLLSGTDLDDAAHPRIAAYAPRFARAAEPDPDRGDWHAWKALLADRSEPEQDAAMLFERPDGFRTRSSALIAIPAYPGFQSRPLWLHAERGSEDETFRAVM